MYYSSHNKLRENWHWIKPDSNISMTINKIKSIVHAQLEIPLSGGVFLFVGSNGVGKSTIVYSIAQLMSKSSLPSFGIKYGNGDSYIQFECDGITNKWDVDRDLKRQNSVYVKLNPPHVSRLRINGMYEGSLFYGFRFQNNEKVQKLLNDGTINENVLSPADNYIIDKLGFILRGDANYYKSSGLLRIKNKDIVQQCGFEQTPYFMKIGNDILSQYEMSSGECLMLSLLHFIYYSIVMRSLDIKRPVLMLIDEIELALHPIAITRLLELFDELTEKRSNLTIILTSHSPEVINKVKPNHIYLIEEDTNDPVNTLCIQTPCYPSYAIRDVYRHDGYDWLLLVEDDLAKIVLEKLISDMKITQSQLIHITPVGGWENVLKLQYDLFKNNVLGVDKHIISILDGDVQIQANSNKWTSMPKLYLPFSSIEKFLKTVLVDNKNQAIFKRINDDLFQLKSLTELVTEYKNNVNSKDNNGKRLYSTLLAAVKERKIDEPAFVSRIATIIEENVDFTSFKENLTKVVIDRIV
jgi:predicted ATPase